MKRSGIFKKVFQGTLYRLLYPLLMAVLLLGMPGVSLLHAVKTADTSDQPAWANPSATALKQVSPIASAQHRPNFMSNLGCTALTYRLVGSITMQTGCFTPTAFGMLDGDSETVIFNGTDEGLPLLPASPRQVLEPWPKALNLLTFDASDTGGSYVHMYDNPLPVMQDQRDGLGRLVGKKLTAPPERTLLDASGRTLVVHPQATAISDNGSWMVVETIYGYFARINLASLQVVPFGPAFNSPGGSEPQDAQVSISSDGRYVAVANRLAPSFKVYDLATCSGQSASWQANNCQSHEYWPFVAQQIAGLQSIQNVRFVNDGLLSFEATSVNSANSAVYELAPTASITALTDYIGLGDSYTSGEGAFDYLSGTDTADNSCHLSANSYPLLLTHDLFSASGGHSVACSGAVINDAGNTSDAYRGQVRDGLSLAELEQSQPNLLGSIKTNYLPGYLAQQAFVRQYQPQLVTISIGGNDVGFGDILERCVVPHISRHVSDETCYNTYESRMELVNFVNRTVLRWTALYRQLQAESPGTTIYAVGYPSIASDTGECPLNVNLGKSELEFAEELIHYLDGAMQQAAVAAGVQYVDVSQALAGHRLCEASGSSVAVNGLTAGSDFGAFGANVLGRESYHPNALGHQLLEQAILQKTHNLTDAPGGGTAPSNDSQTLLNAPKTGRPINSLVPANIMNRVVQPGASASLKVDGVSSGLRPNSSYTVRLDGPTGQVLATLTTDASGNLSGSITMPAGTELGGHTVDVVGLDQSGGPVDVTQPIYVAGSPSDADSDGVADPSDSCPYALNSGQDIDQDGVDDVCDAVIGPPPINAGTSTITVRQVTTRVSAK